MRTRGRPARLSRSEGARPATRGPRGQTPPGPNRRVDLVPLNTHAIRRKALKAHHQAEEALDGVRLQLKRFHEADIPGFQRWLHHAFGALLTRQRELQQTLAEKRALALEITRLADLFDLTEVDAYRKALWRQAHPAEAEEEDRRFAEARRQAGGPDSWADPFQDEPWTAESEAEDPFGDDFDLPDDEQAAFRAFFEEMTGRPPPAGAFRAKPAGPHPEEKSARDLYRTIVRRLHPDHHGQMNDVRKNLWHETQDAYRRRDVNALYNILARCDGGEAGLGVHSPVALILRLTRQLKQALRTARADVRRSERDMAWDYATRVRNPAFVRSVRVGLEQTVRTLTWELEELAEVLAGLEAQARRGPRHAPRRGARRHSMDPDLQAELPF